MVVPANIAEFATDWSLPIDDLRMWVCLQEVATHAVLRVPHVRARLDSFMTQYAAGFEPDSSDFLSRFESVDPTSAEGGFEAMFSDPELMLGALRSDAQRALLPAYEALVATIVGYVDHLMDTVGVGLLSRYSMIAEAIRRRRVETDASDRFVEKLFGLELTQATVDRGEAFVHGVLERSDEATLARVWESEATLPTPAELDAPGLWLARLEFTSPD
jgi:putative hydrolase